MVRFSSLLWQDTCEPLTQIVMQKKRLLDSFGIQAS